MAVLNRSFAKLTLAVGVCMAVISNVAGEELDFHPRAPSFSSAITRPGRWL